MRVLTMLHADIRGLHTAAYVIAFLTLGSQVLALLRDRVFAHQFGAGETLDLFYAAFRIPDVMYALLASMVSLFVLIPFLERAEHNGASGVRDFLSEMFTVFSGALIVCAALGWYIAPELVGFLYGGFSTTQQEMLVPIVRILLMQPLLLGVSNLCASYVQMRGRFLLYAIAPILYNIGIIVGAVFLYPQVGLVGLAWGVVLGAGLHLGVQVPFMVQHGVVPRIVMPHWRRVGEVVRLSLPRTLTLSMQQIVLIVLVSLASYFVAGSVSSFTFAWNLTAVPLALIGASYSVAAFPTLVRLYGGGDLQGYRSLIVTASRQIIFWALPACVLFVVLRAQIVRVLLGSGSFDWHDTMMTAAVLALLAISLVAQGLVLLLVRACYAAGKTFAPLLIHVVTALFTVAVAYALLYGAAHGFVDLAALTHFMRVPETAGGEVLLLALAYSLGVFLNVALVMWYIETRVGSFVSALYASALQVLLASLAAGAGAYLLLHVLDDLVSLQTTIGVVLQGAAAGCGGLAVWYVVLGILKNEDFLAVRGELHRRLTHAHTRGSIGEG